MQFLFVYIYFLGNQTEVRLRGDGPDPHHKIHEYMDGDDVEWSSLSRFGWETKSIWTYFIVILFSSFGSVSLLFYLFEIIYVKHFDLMGQAQ